MRRPPIPNISVASKASGERFVSERSQEARRIVAAQVDGLQAIVRRAQSDGDFDGAFERLSRWKARTVRLLAESVSHAEAQGLATKRKGSFIMGDPLRNLADEADMYRGFLQALDEQLESHGDEIIDIPSPADTGPPGVKAPLPAESRTIFIIHGRDELNLLRLKELLRERWGLEPLVLSGEAGRGRTLIEKFEQEAQRAVFALALMTPDDVVDTGQEEYIQARPNAVFELGWFYGRLGRSRVCILLRKGTTLHSDLDGISRIHFHEQVSEVVDQLERELVETGVLAR